MGVLVQSRLSKPAVFTLHVITSDSHPVHYSYVSERARPNTLIVVCWWWRLPVNGACIWDAFDNHVHISELPCRNRPEWLTVFCLFPGINPEWSYLTNHLSLSLDACLIRHSGTLYHCGPTFNLNELYSRCLADRCCEHLGHMSLLPHAGKH